MLAATEIGHIESFRPKRFSQRYGVDPFLTLVVVITALYGLIVLYSASGQNISLVLRQAAHVIAGLGIMLVISQARQDVVVRITPFVFALSAFLLVAVLFIGVDVKGAQRWLDLPGFPRFQPSELVKLALPAMLAWWFTRQKLPPRLSQLIIAAVLIAAPVTLIAKQPDLGTSIIIAGSGFFVIFLAGISWRLLAILGGLAVASLPVLWMVMRDYQRTRVMTLLDPQSDPLGAGWNTIQAMTALGSGGLFGKGYAAGTQAQLKFLPESHTDFIVAVIGEEMGFLGISVLLILYAAILGRCLALTMRATGNFGRLLSGSITLTFFVYVFVNLGMVSGVLPVVGVPLPLISYGGTSVVSLLIGFGLIMSMQRTSRVLSGES
ncbi:MAG: rod shape-determining protein RodA [Gammaproteobacteria bacterium]|nr:rod shape-determining protein RodA [Gammaproteobacteria bacterium]HAN81042.1 rod shape-determining protein RodA [Gammaproteobacteria bacterium]|tara:strand:- start:298 stop:1434 length:1137 start_codon:yes stop_codon:yes gene_type:complete